MSAPEPILAVEGVRAGYQSGVDILQGLSLAAAEGPPVEFGPARVEALIRECLLG